MQNNHKFLVSVIIPTKNSDKTLRLSLSSIKKQTYSNIESIIVDNHSSDQTINIAKEFEANVYTKGPERSTQRNFGAKIAKGKYLIFLDSDIELSPDVITECMELVKRGYKVITFPEIIIGEGFWAKCRALEARCYLGDDLIEAPRFYNSTVFAELGGFDENIIAGEDWDLRERATKRNFTIGRITALTMHHEGRVSLIARLKKKYYYGKTINRYLIKHKGIQWKQFPLFRSCYYSHWRLLAKHPFLTTGLMFLKLGETAFVSLGVINYKLKKLRKSE